MAHLTLSELRRSTAYHARTPEEQQAIERAFSAVQARQSDGALTITVADIEAAVSYCSEDELPALSLLRGLAGQANAAQPVPPPPKSVVPIVARNTAHNNVAGLARALVDKTLGKTGTDEEFVYKAFQLAFAYGQVDKLASAVEPLLRRRGVHVEGTRPDRHLRYIINQEMGGEERQRAIDFLEVGYDRMSATDWAYRAQGFLKTFDDIGGAMRDNPALAVVGVAAGVGLAVAAPPVAAMVGLGFLAFGTGKVVKNELEAAFFSGSRSQRIQNLREAGKGGALLLTAAPSLTQISTLVGAAQAARIAGASGGFVAGAGAFVRTGSPLATGSAATSSSSASKASLTSEQIGTFAAELKNVLPNANCRTVCISTSGLSTESTVAVGSAVEATVASMAQRVVTIGGASTDDEVRWLAFYNALHQAFPEANLPVMNQSPSVSWGQVIQRALKSIHDAGGFSKEQPLTLVVKNFVPHAKQFESLSSWIRAYAQSSSRGDEASKGVRFVITSETPIYNWGSAQGGFNIGEHIIPAALTDVP